MLVLVLAGAFSVLSVLGASALRIDPRVEALLPPDMPSIRALEEMRQRLPAAAPPLYLLVQSSDPELNRSLVRKLQAAVSEWPETRWAMRQRDPSVFLDHRLLFLPLEELEEFTEQIEERVRWEECERVPGCTNLDDEAPPLPTDEELREALERNPDVSAMVSLFGADTEAFVEAKATGADEEARERRAAEEAADDSTLGELCSPDGHVCSLIVSLDGDADDLDFATEILERSEALFRSVQPEQPPQDLKMAVSGQYRNLPMTRRSVATDLSQTTLLSLALVALVIASQFRTLRSFVVLLVPALMAILWTAGLLGALGIELNLISSFTLAVLAGVGIDFGVHLLTHYCERREQTDNAVTALQQTFGSLGTTLLVAACTTAFGFAVLSVASFRGFSQMGPIASAGVVASLASFVLLFPALVLTLDRTQRSPFVQRRFASPPWAWLRRRALAVAVTGIATAAVALFVGQRVSFEYDTRKLQPRTVSHGIDWTKTMHGTTRTAVYMLADEPAALHRAASQLRAEPPLELIEPERPFLLVPGAFLPDQQPEKLELVARLRTSIERAERQAGEAARQRIDDFKPLVQVNEPLTQEKMPRWVSDWLIERDGRFGTFGILYTKLSGANARHMERLAEHMARWQARFDGVRFASPVSPLGEVTPRLRQEAPYIIGLALLGVCLSMLATVRSPRRALLVLMPLAMMVAFSLAVMVGFDWRLNLYNMLVFPLAFGIGVDGAIYVAWAMRRGAPLEDLTATGRAVLGSTLTTMAGFGSLMRSGNPGLASIGQLATLMLAMALLANLVWLPAVQWAARARRQPEGGRHPS